MFDFDLSSSQALMQLKLLSVGHLCALVSEVVGISRFELPIAISEPEPYQRDFRLSRYQHVQFNQPFCGLILSRHLLKQPNRQYASVVSAATKRYVDYLREQYPASLETLVYQVASALLSSGDCSLERVAAAIDLHPRLLQIKLREQGSSYMQIMHSVRRTLAEDHLRRRSMTITDLALNLGYADVAVFSRNFKQWTGLSPKQWQRSTSAQ